MKIRPLDEHIHQFRGDQLLVPNNVCLSPVVEAQRGIRRADRENVNDPGLRIGRIPVAGIFFEANPVVDPPVSDFIRPADRQRTDVQPLVAIFFNGLPRHNQR